jgi:hypothetical protein
MTSKKKLEENFQYAERKTIFSYIGDACLFSRPGDYLEITEWTNGDGFDIDINSKTGIQKISITYGEFRLLKHMVKKHLE